MSSLTHRAMLISRHPRHVRRAMLDAEAKARKTGKWGPWEAVPAARASHGWLSEVKTAHRNLAFCVLERDLGDGGKHFAIMSLSDVRPTFHEMQRIKNELAGPTWTGVEIYPPASELVDGADMFHLWARDEELPYSLWHWQRWA